MNPGLTASVTAAVLYRYILIVFAVKYLSNVTSPGIFTLAFCHLPLQVWLIYKPQNSEVQTKEMDENNINEINTYYYYYYYIKVSSQRDGSYSAKPQKKIKIAPRITVKDNC